MSIPLRNCEIRYRTELMFKVKDGMAHNRSFFLRPVRYTWMGQLILSWEIKDSAGPKRSFVRSQFQKEITNFDG